MSSPPPFGKSFSWLLSAVALLFFVDLGRSEEPSELFRNAKTVCFLGDSITHSGKYISYLDLLVEAKSSTKPRLINMGLSSETVSGLSEEGHAGGKFPRPDLFERLQRVLGVAKADLVVACYGMNCGIYLPLEEQRFQRYKDGIHRLRKAVEESGAKLILVTPASFDDIRGKKGFSYNAVLDAYSDWLMERKKDGWAVIDIHHPMTTELQKRRMLNPEFTFQPDAVHPNDEGHWFMSRILMKELGLDGAANWESPEAMMGEIKIEPVLLKLVDDRMKVLRDAYVATAGHLRPGVPKGLPMEEAIQKAKQLSEEIQKKRGSSR